MGVCNCSVLFYVILFHSSIAIILMGKRELVALLNLSSWCLVMVMRLFLALPRGCLRFVIVVFPDHTHLRLFLALPRGCLRFVIVVFPDHTHLLFLANYYKRFVKDFSKICVPQNWLLQKDKKQTFAPKTGLISAKILLTL